MNFLALGEEPLGAGGKRRRRHKRHFPLKRTRVIWFTGPAGDPHTKLGIIYQSSSLHKAIQKKLLFFALWFLSFGLFLISLTLIARFVEREAVLFCLCLLFQMGFSLARLRASRINRRYGFCGRRNRPIMHLTRIETLVGRGSELKSILGSAYFVYKRLIRMNANN